MIKSLALLEIVGKQVGRRQDFFIFFREHAQVEVAIGGDKAIVLHNSQKAIIIFFISHCFRFFECKDNK